MPRRRARKSPPSKSGVRVPKYRRHFIKHYDPRDKHLPPAKRRVTRTSDLAFVEVNGEKVYLGEYGTPESKAAYERLIGSMRNGKIESPGSDSHPLTLADVILRYLREREDHFTLPPSAPDSVAFMLRDQETGEVRRFRRGIRHELAALRPVNRMFGTTPARDFDANAAEAVRQKMLRQHLTEKGKDGRPRRRVSPNTIKARMNVMVSMLTWAASRQFVPADVVLKLNGYVEMLPKNLKGRRHVVQRAAFDEVQTRVVSPVRAMMDLQVLTAARPEELCRLRVRDIVARGSVWRANLDWHKNAMKGRTRVLYFGPAAQAILKPFLHRAKDAYLFSPRDAVREFTVTPKALEGRVLTDHYTKDTYRQSIQRACDKAHPMPEELRVQGKHEIPEPVRAKRSEWRSAHRWSPYQLRHTAATLFRLTYGKDLTGRLLGHAGDVTDLYTHGEDTELTRAVAGFDPFKHPDWQVNS
ncbi:MAG: site-specific integrase [Phycisphaerae bacterium]|nr:site-specific integrase [Phycisphaerae bacterium]